MRRAILILFLLAAVLVISGCGSHCNDKALAQDGHVFPKFSAVASDGKKYTEKDISKGPAVVGFLVSWCVTCGMELVSLQEIREEFLTKNLPVIAFTYEDPLKFEKLLDSLEVEIPIIKADSTMFNTLEIDAIPTRFLLIDGCEIMRITGAPSFDEGTFRSAIRKELKLPEPESDENSPQA